MEATSPARHRPALIDLATPDATDGSLVGAKAANLARAAAAGLPVLPGMVLSTAWDHRGWSHPSRPGRAVPARAAWCAVSEAGSRPVVVRSSPTGEDGGASSPAGGFTAVLDVAAWPAFVAAVDEVLASGARAAGPDARMAVLVQPQVVPRWGGVLFGADPVGGRADRLLVSAVEGGPDRPVRGQDGGWTAVLSPRGRILEHQDGGRFPLPRATLRALAGLARRATAAFGAPQDIEWAVEADGTLWLLRSRPIISPTGRPAGHVLGTGPVAETFPGPPSRLESDLWLAPLDDGLTQGPPPHRRRRCPQAPPLTSVRGHRRLPSRGVPLRRRA